MAASLSQQKKKLRDVMERMKKKYGITRLGSNDPDVDLLVFLILRDGWDFRKAARAVRELQEAFVDWNEVRVSFPREILGIIGHLEHKKMDEKIQRIKGVLKELFCEYNRMSLEFLLEADFDETRKFFTDLEDLGKANAYIFMQCLQDYLDEAPAGSSKNLVMSSEAIRVGVRLGLIRKTSSHNVARRDFMKLLNPAKYTTFQNLFVNHAEVICRPKPPLCEECFLTTLCNYYKA